MEVRLMTDNFREKIEENWLGTMYHGMLRTGQEVAVKVRAPISHHALRSHSAAQAFHLLRSHSAAEEFHQFETVKSLISSSTNHV